jgi:DNA-binding response OmpR family regulator
MSAQKFLLLVEDEVLVSDLLAEALIDAGFEVLVAADGTRAIRDLEEDTSRFQCVITDIRLPPGPDGWEMGHRARELDHSIAIIYISGDSAVDWASKGVPNSVMLTKPFAAAQLVTAVSTLLNEADKRNALS